MHSAVMNKTQRYNGSGINNIEVFLECPLCDEMEIYKTQNAQGVVSFDYYHPLHTCIIKAQPYLGDPFPL